MFGGWAAAPQCAATQLTDKTSMTWMNTLLVLGHLILDREVVSTPYARPSGPQVLIHFHHNTFINKSNTDKVGHILQSESQNKTENLHIYTLIFIICRNVHHLYNSLWVRFTTNLHGLLWAPAAASWASSPGHWKPSQLELKLQERRDTSWNKITLVYKYSLNSNAIFVVSNAWTLNY